MLAAGVLVAVSSAATKLATQAGRPNILVIMCDDVGYWNTGIYSHGGYGVPTPNIDRIGREGMLFTDHYAAPSCTPGRAMFLTGQLPIRTGLTTVGMPGSPIGLSPLDPTIAEILLEAGYNTGQFGKSHVGDRNEHLPTVHGFQVFYGNLYHLNSSEEPFLKFWPNDAGFNQRYQPRGVLDCKMTDRDDSTVDPRFGRVGKQTIRDTGPIPPKRMETLDDEFEARTLNFMEQSVKEKKPFFAWHNPSRMHIYTHVPPGYKNKSYPFTEDESDVYGDGIMQLDDSIGRILKKLDDLKIAKNTIVIFTTDNGAMVDWYPDAGTTPFRGEKATTWEGGVRVPFLVRWPAQVPAGSANNGIQDHTDVFTTLLSAAGIKDIKQTLEQRSKVYIDGVDNLASWTSNKPSARDRIYYYNESQLTAVRLGPWKNHFETREGFFDYNRPSTLLFNLRNDPFERMGDFRSRATAMKFGIAWGGRVQDAISEHMATLTKFPPRQKGGSLRITE